jgi:DNA polymerase-4
LLHMQKLAQKVYERSSEFLFKTVTIKIRYKDFHTITRSHSFSVSTTKFDQVLYALKQSLEEVDFSKGIRLVGVKLDNLSKIAQQQMCLADF